MSPVKGGIGRPKWGLNILLGVVLQIDRAYGAAGKFCEFRPSTHCGDPRYWSMHIRCLFSSIGASSL